MVGNRPLGGCVGDSRQIALCAEYRTLPPGGRQPTISHSIPTYKKTDNRSSPNDRNESENRKIGRREKRMRQFPLPVDREIAFDCPDGVEHLPTSPFFFSLAFFAKLGQRSVYGELRNLVKSRILRKKGKQSDLNEIGKLAIRRRSSTNPCKMRCGKFRGMRSRRRRKRKSNR